MYIRKSRIFMSKVKSIVSLFLLFLFLVVLSPVFAQTIGPINLTISPTFVSLATDPGQEATSQFNVSNNSNFKEILKIDLAKFEVTRGGAGLTLNNLTSSDDFAKWIKITPETFSLDPDQTQTIRFTISPPKDAALGYYYALVVRRQRDITTQQVKQPVLTGAPALPVLLEVRSPNAKRELQLISFNSQRSFYEYLPATFNVEVKNSGNIHVIPRGDIFIDWGRTKSVAIIPINSGASNILPQQDRILSLDWADGFFVKQQDGKLKWDLSKGDRFRIGRYTANLLLVYDNGQRDVPLEATITFWVFPWKIILGLLVIVYFAFVGLKGTIYSYVRKFRHRS